MTFTLTSTVQTAANDAALKKINADWARLVSLGEQHEAMKIKFVNLGREIGLSLQGLCSHKQMHLSFFENIKAQLPASLDFAAVQKCIRLCNAFPEKIATVEEAREAEQLLFVAVGLEEEPKRIGTQVSHDSTPDTFIFTTLAMAKDKLARRLAESDSWDDETKASVKDQIEKHKQWLEEVEAKL